MSLIERYYNFVYGGLIGHPRLTEMQWQEVHGAARSRSLRPILIGFGALGVLPLLLDGVLITLVFAHPGPPLDTLMYCLTSYVAICPIVTTMVHRRLAARHIRTAANELGFVRVCVECGYDCRSLPKDSVQCPECGAVAARPSTRAREQT